MTAVVISDKNDRGKEVSGVKSYTIARAGGFAFVFRYYPVGISVLVIPPVGANRVLNFKTERDLVDWYRGVVAADQPTTPVSTMKVCRHCGMHMPAGSNEDDCLYYKSQQQSA